MDKSKIAGKSKKPTTSGCQSATARGDEVNGNCCPLEVITSYSYCLCETTVKQLVEGLGSLLANKASIQEHEPYAPEDNRGPADVFYVFVTTSYFNDLHRVMTSASLLPSRFHADLLSVNSNLTA